MPQRAKVAIPQLVAAARLTGLAGGLATFHAGRHGAQPAAARAVLRPLQAGAGGLRTGPRRRARQRPGRRWSSRPATRARVRLRYTLAGQPVDAVRAGRAPRRPLVPERPAAPCRGRGGGRPRPACVAPSRVPESPRAGAAPRGAPGRTGIMAAMPKQTPLPFPRHADQRRRRSDPTRRRPTRLPRRTDAEPTRGRRRGARDAGAPRAGRSTGPRWRLADPTTPVDRAGRLRPTRAAGAAPPWWARLLGQLMAPWVALTIEPEAPAEHAPTGDRPVCYVLEDYGLSQRADPGARLPRSRPAVAAAAAAGRPARAQARLRRAVAPQRQPAGAAAAVAGHRAAVAEDPFGLARAAARRAPRRPVAGRATGAGVDLRRPRAGQAAAAGSRCCSRKTGRWSAASAGCWRSRSTAATRMVRFAPPVSLRAHHRRGPAARAHRAQAVARAAHPLPPASAPR